LFRHTESTLRIYALGASEWDELVPAPGPVWTPLVAEVRRLSRLVRPPCPGGLVGRLREWVRGRPPAPEVGWLVYQLGASRYEIAVAINPLPPYEELRLNTRPAPAADRELAADILKRAAGAAGLIEFEYEWPPESSSQPSSAPTEGPTTCSPSNPQTNCSPSQNPGDTCTS
jgi:hypothetical protein